MDARSLREEEAARSNSQFPVTVKRFMLNPSAGQTVLFRIGNELIGYALLIPYESVGFVQRCNAMLIRLLHCRTGVLVVTEHCL